MSNATAAVVIPYRDRGSDPLRAANLWRVLEHWSGLYGIDVHVVDDGRAADAQFCRSRAYNRGSKLTDADVLVYTESDMLLGYEQIHQAIEIAATEPGLVVPFTEYHALSAEDSLLVRQHKVSPADCVPQSSMTEGTSIGAVNVVSRETLELVGQWDETLEGSWYDDRCMERAFAVCSQPTRYITGPAFHLYHLPGWKGDHLTAEDKAATARNKARWKLYQKANTPERVRELTAGGT